ncbi:hypothetical protein AQUCO_04900076v1 [Aquilegia coerulea]|uniref:Auxin-responsive protein n=1 Tax=Aquilegia coerulea TaxID=218851 RepID=A0A2G5CJT5_AQUCA|nr:hypothetical protein AQUCO_04900076v1 [Aquilegia coerulea]
MEVCRKMMNFEETELRLGLPGGGSEAESGKSTGKRGFSETIDLKLNNLPSKDGEMDPSDNKVKNSPPKEKNLLPTNDPAKPPAAKAQVVGWPPVRSFRKNILSVQKSNTQEEKGMSSAAFVKVSMDGAPYLRKVDLKMYKSYQDLSDALGKMFSSFTIEI